MSNPINGVSFVHKDNYVLCCVEDFSIDFQNIIRKRLSSVCYGIAKSKTYTKAYSYKNTLEQFMARFSSKSAETKKGMIGELLVHTLALELFKKFEVISPYFNMEEKSIRKGFDILLYDNSLHEIWITEVKSGELHKNKCGDATTSELLNSAFLDLKKRLNEKEITYWDQAINSAKVAIEDEKDYKKVVERILSNEIELISDKHATSKDNNVILVSVLFDNIANKINKLTPKTFSENNEKIKEFNKLIVISIQKSTYRKVVDFFEEEIK